MLNGWVDGWVGEFIHPMVSFLVTSPQETGGSLSQDSGYPDQDGQLVLSTTLHCFHLEILRNNGVASTLQDGDLLDPEGIPTSTQ